MSVVYVSFTAYRPGTTEIITEGRIPVQSISSVTAQEVVRAMYPGLDVVIRSTT